MTQPPVLSEDDLAELDSFLLSDACDEDTLSLDEAHGYLTALIVGPDTGGTEDWMSSVWGQPRFPSEDVKRQMTGFMNALHADVAAALESDRGLEPLAVEVEEGGGKVVSYEGWCLGFMLGVESRQALWDQLPKNEQALLAPIAQLALLSSDEEPDMDEEEYAAWVELLPGAVRGLYAFWHSPRGRRLAKG